MQSSISGSHAYMADKAVTAHVQDALRVIHVTAVCINTRKAVT